MEWLSILVSFVVNILSRVRLIPILAATAYVLYLIWQSIKALRATGLHDPIRALLYWMVDLGGLLHVLGVTAIALSIILIYFPNKRLFNFIVPLLWNSKRVSATGIEPEMISEKEVQDRIRGFSQDAISTRILAGDADFLVDDQRQFDEILDSASKYIMLLDETYSVDPTKLKQLIDNGLEARVYPASVIDNNLRGRLKQTSLGRSACIFNKRGSQYEILELTNVTLVNILFANFDEWFSKGRNPLIRHIIFDLAGVFFEGDIESFFSAVNTMIGTHIVSKSEDYLLVDADLNLGKCDIVQYVTKVTGATIDNGCAQQIRDKWGSTWKRNDGMNMVAEGLKSQGYTVSISSNCDKENADRYYIRGYLDVFEHRFLSCQVQLLKPSQAYFEHILKVLDAEPFECVFIDDHPSNTDMAEQLGFVTINVGRGLNPDEVVEYVKKRFDELRVVYS
jgi:putative hydrolase of the HAD superfamily